MAAAVARRRERVNRIDHPARCPQRTNQQSAVGFDRHRHRVGGCVTTLGQHRQQLGEPRDVVADPVAGHHPPRIIDDGHIVMGFRPIDSAVQLQPFTAVPVFPLVTSLGGGTQCSNRRTPWSDISLAVRDSRPPQDRALWKSPPAREHLTEVDPAAGSSNGIHHPQCGSAARRPLLSKDVARQDTPGIHPMADPHRNTNHAATAAQSPIPTND